MYTVWMSNPKTFPVGECVYDNTVSANDFQFIDPVLELEVNTAGTFTFSITPENLNYHNIDRLTSILQVVRDGVILWEGRPLQESMDWDLKKTYTCEGALAYLNDTTQPHKVYSYSTGRTYFETLIAIHNQKVAPYKRFEIGAVTVDLSTFPERILTNYETTMELVNQLIETFGGHLYVQYHDNGKKTIHWLKDWISVAEQSIEFGENLLDYAHEYDISELVTVVQPLGKEITEIERENATGAYEEDPNKEGQRLDISEVNEGSPYLISQEAYEKWGWIERPLEFDDIDDPNALKELGTKYLQEQQFDNMTLTVNMYDLSLNEPRIDWRPSQEVLT